MKDPITRLAEALRPFANAVFNDNGDMTVDSSTPRYEDFVKAYFVVRAFDLGRLTPPEDVAIPCSPR